MPSFEEMLVKVPALLAFLGGTTVAAVLALAVVIAGCQMMARQNCSFASALPHFT